MGNSVQFTYEMSVRLEAEVEVECPATQLPELAHRKMISVVDPALISQIRELGMVAICDEVHAKESSDEGGT